MWRIFQDCCPLKVYFSFEYNSVARTWVCVWHAWFRTSKAYWILFITARFTKIVYSSEAKDSSLSTFGLISLIKFIKIYYLSLLEISVFCFHYDGIYLCGIFRSKLNKKKVFCSNIFQLEINQYFWKGHLFYILSCTLTFMHIYDYPIKQISVY
jgi:hypothetical protein